MTPAAFVLLFSLFRITQAGICEYSSDGQLFKHQSSNCHYVQCNHGRAVSRRCPSGLGIHPQFTVGYRNPCVVQQPECHRLAKSIENKQADKLINQQQLVAKESMESDTDEHVTPDRNQYYKELIPESQHHITNGFVNFGYSPLNHEINQNTQYQPLQFGANNNFDNSFGYVLDSVQAEVSPGFNTDQIINYQFDPAQVYVNSNPHTSSGQIQVFSDISQYQPPNDNVGQTNQYPPNTQNLPGEFQYQYHQSNSASDQNNNFAEQQHTVQPSHLAQSQSPVFGQHVQAPSISFQHIPVVNPYSQQIEQPVNSVPSTAIHQNQVYNTQTHTNQPSHLNTHQAGIVFSVPSNLQPNNNLYTPPAVEKHVSYSQQLEVNPAATSYQPRPLYQTPGIAVQPTPQLQTTYTAQTRPLTTKQKQEALQKLIPFLTRLQPVLQSNHQQPSYQHTNNPSKQDRRRAVLVKILKRLIQAMKQGVLLKPRKTSAKQMNNQNNLAQTRFSQHSRKRIVQKPINRQSKRRRGGARHRPYRRRRLGIMGKMANGQGVRINTNGVDKENQEDSEEYDDFENSEDYVSDYENEESHDSANGNQDNADPIHKESTDEFKIDYNSPGTNAPVTDGTKFRHMRDGIRVPYSKEGISLFDGVDQDFRAAISPSSKQQTLTQNGQQDFKGHIAGSTRKVDKGSTSKTFTGESSQIDVENDFFSDEVPIEYIDKLRKLAVEYFNDEYDVTDQPSQYEDYNLARDFQQISDYNDESKSTQYNILGEQSENTEQQQVTKSTLPPDPISDSEVQTSFDQAEIYHNNRHAASQQTQPSNRKQPPTDAIHTDKQPDTEAKTLKEDIAFQQALTYYSKLLNSLSDFLGESGVESVTEAEVGQSSPVEQTEENVQNEELQNYSYQDLTTEVNVEEFQSNELSG